MALSEGTNCGFVSTAPSADPDDTTGGIDGYTINKKNDELYNKMDPEGREEYADLSNDIKRTISVINSVSIMWNTTRAHSELGNKNISKWAQILMREYNIFGVIDGGSSLIHDNEPRQAVFFKSSILEHIMTLNNPAKNTYINSSVLGLFVAMLSNMLADWTAGNVDELKVLTPEEHKILGDFGVYIKLNYLNGYTVIDMHDIKKYKNQYWKPLKKVIGIIINNKKKYTQGIEPQMNKLIKSFYYADKER